MRIVSLVPSWTEYMYDLDVQVVGQTKFCVRPNPTFRNLGKVGGTKKINIDSVLALRPDLVLANREENDRGQVEALLAQCPSTCQVVVTDVRTVQSAWDTMLQLGEWVERAALAQEWVAKIQARWGDPRAALGSAGYAVWSSPWMVAGADTYIHDVMQHWGIKNAFLDLQGSRYPTLANDPDSGVSQCQSWLLPSEPFPFQEKHVTQMRVTNPEARFQLVDGEAFSWYGSRMYHVTHHLKDVAQWVSQSQP